MKALFFVALSVVALMPAVAGTTLPADAAPAVRQEANLNITTLALLKAQGSSSDSTLSRPL